MLSNTNLFLKSVLSLVFVFCFGSLEAQTVADSNTCIQRQDLVDIAEKFSQFSSLIDDKELYCSGDIGEQWVQVLKALVTLKALNPREVDQDPNDAFTFKALEEPNWWEYFVNRARALSIPETCQEGVVAFVRPMFMDGRIYFCKSFFEASTTSQISTLMHEVRHFDGHGHVTCRRGLDAGISGACDEDILRKGSYAIDVQTLVAMSKIADIEKSEKNRIEAEAIFTAFNRFNSIPQVKINEAIVLSNTQGEVYRWGIGESYELVGRLASPARVYNSYNNLTIYPLNPEEQAYRMDKDLVSSIPSVGLFAVHYNNEPPAERALYNNVTYLGTGGLIKNNQLITYCSGSTPKVENLDSFGEFDRVIAVSKDEVDSERVSLILSKTGQILQFKCTQRGEDSVVIEPFEINMSADIKNLKEAFGLGGKTYGVLENGQLARLKLQENTLVATNTVFPFINENWVSATPFNQPEIFSE